MLDWLDTTFSGIDLLLAFLTVGGGAYGGGRAAAVARYRVATRTRVFEQIGRLTNGHHLVY